MSYEQIKDLPHALFKRYRGVKRDIFDRLAAFVSNRRARMRIKPGRPLKLPVVDRV